MHWPGLAVWPGMHARLMCMYHIALLRQTCHAAHQWYCVVFVGNITKAAFKAVADGTANAKQLQIFEACKKGTVAQGG